MSEKPPFNILSLTADNPVHGEISVPHVEKRGPGRPPKDGKQVDKKEPEQDPNKPIHLSVSVDQAVDVQFLEIITDRRRLGQRTTKQDLLIEAIQMLFARENKLRIAAAKAREKPHDMGDEE